MQIKGVKHHLRGRYSEKQVTSSNCIFKWGFPCLFEALPAYFILCESTVNQSGCFKLSKIALRCCFYIASYC
jgi:hypothetical protein